MTDILDEEADLIERVKRLEGKMEPLTSLLEGRKIERWLIALVIPALIGAVGFLLVWSVGRIEASAERVGETAAELRALKEKTANQAADIVELRAQLWSLGRRSSAAPISPPPTSTDDALPPPPDKFTLFGHRFGGHDAAALGGSGRDSGRVLLHVPKLQNGHPLLDPEVHSMLVLHVVPHVLRGLTTGDEAQLATTINAIMMEHRIPEM